MPPDHSVRLAHFLSMPFSLTILNRPQHANDLLREVTAMKIVSRHPHILELLDVFETDTHLCVLSFHITTPESELTW